MHKLLILLLLLPFVTTAYSKEQDGIWFLGFNLKQAIWQKDSGKQLRQLLLNQISRKEINQTLWSESLERFPWVPFGNLQSIDSKIELSPEWKKTVLEQLSPSQKNELKKIVVLHTDGPQTLIVFYQLKAQLQPLGVNLVSQVLPMYPQELWERTLQKGQHHLFLMGFKAEKYPAASSLICPLLSSQGLANFTGYQNSRLDEACSEPEDLTADTIKMINDDLPLWPIYYIEKLP